MWPFRFRFLAKDPIFFPSDKAANTLRGAFGSIFRKLACVTECESVQTCAIAPSCPYARIFEPRQPADGGPSGLADWPRPFVFRALHLNGIRVPTDQIFHFDLVLFQPPEKALPFFVLAFRKLAEDGLGPGRGRASLIDVIDLSSQTVLYDSQQFTNASAKGLHFDLSVPAADTPMRLSIEFQTPTELKSGSELATKPEFKVLFARLRDRISNLKACYQGGPLKIDFGSLGDAAEQIQMTSSTLRQVDALRRSAKTGQTHPISGFVGNAEYCGEFGPFLPFLNVGQWVGAGRQTVWGKGVFSCKYETSPQIRAPLWA